MNPKFNLILPSAFIIIAIFGGTVFMFVDYDHLPGTVGLLMLCNLGLGLCSSYLYVDYYNEKKKVHA